MSDNPGDLRGWKLVGLSTAAIVMMLTIVFAVHGFGAEGFAAAIRWTARTSFVLFLTAFSASSLRVVLPSPKTRWLLANRRYFGVSFAISHLFHAAAIIGRTVVGGPGEGRTLAGAAPGGVVYLFILFMLATSFDRTAAWVGPKVWRTMHTLGGYLVFFSFLSAYGGRALVSPWHLPYVILLLAVLGLRIVKWRRRGAAGAPPPARRAATATGRGRVGAPSPGAGVEGGCGRGSG